MSSFSAKSPLFSHVNSTLNGLPTIRSSGAGIEKMMIQQFDVLQDYHSGAWYLVLACGTAFGLALDIITCLFIACICFSFILLDGKFFDLFKIFILIRAFVIAVLESDN